MIINTIDDKVVNKEVKNMKAVKAFFEPLFKEGDEDEDEDA